jgi:hypothetical protein
MYYFEILKKLSDSERCKEKDLINDRMIKDYECSEAQKELRRYQDKYKKIDFFICYCKKRIRLMPISPCDIPVWELASDFGPEKDFCISTKAYAYLLYYKKQLKIIAKIISRLKIEVKNCQREKDLAEKALNDFDNSINKKYGCNVGIK